VKISKQNIRMSKQNTPQLLPRLVPGAQKKIKHSNTNSSLYRVWFQAHKKKIKHPNKILLSFYRGWFQAHKHAPHGNRMFGKMAEESIKESLKKGKDDTKLSYDENVRK
jgi:hypothetical protein